MILKNAMFSQFFPRRCRLTSSYRANTRFLNACSFHWYTSLRRRSIHISFRSVFLYGVRIISVSVRIHYDCCPEGVYKPRIRCYDVNQLSMKFERCMDAESESHTPLLQSVLYTCIYTMCVCVCV